MTAVCLIDTSVFVELLDVPVKANRHAETLAALRQRVTAQESLFLPMATILETGNHMGQNGDGGARRACAQRFVQQVSAALEGHSPFKPISFLEADELRAWLSEFRTTPRAAAASATCPSSTTGSACASRTARAASTSGPSMRTRLPSIVRQNSN